MAQRVTAFARRPAGGRAAEKARANIDPEGEPVPLDLTSLVAPYKRHRGLSVRVERLAHGARLTQGRNNGDRSWSLAPDELDGLEYLPPNETYDAHTLAVRIISLEGGDGETLAVIDLPIPGRAVNENGETAAVFDPAALNAELQRLRDELVKVKSALAARETEIATSRRSGDAMERSRQALKAEFAAAEASWDRELREQLAAAAAEAQANLERARAEWDADQKTSRSKSDLGTQRSLEDARKRWQQEAQATLAKAQAEWKVSEAARLATIEASWREQSSKTMSELRIRAEQAEAALTRSRAAVPAKSDERELHGLREELASAQAALNAKEVELAETRAAAELARMGSQNSLTELKKAEQTWKAAEAVRIAGVEARWKEQAAKAVADVAARLDQAEAALAEARAAAEIARSQSQDSAARLKKAEQAWKTAEATRMAAAELRWKEQAAKAVAEATAKFEDADAAFAEARAQADARGHQVSALQASLTAREAELAQLRAAIDEARAQSSTEADQTRDRWQQEMATALAKAQESFKSGEAARLAAAEARWKAQFATALAEATAKLQRAEAALAELNAGTQVERTHAEDELRRLRDELASAQTALEARDSELADTRTAAEQARATADQSLQNVAAEIERARQQWKKESDAAMRKAEKAWRAEEAPRLAAAETKWREEIAFTLDEAKERYERADASAADARSCSEALRHELVAAQNSLAHREIELAEARAAAEQERVRMQHAPITLQERKPVWEAAQEGRRAEFRRRLIRDFAVVASLAGIAFVAFPRVEPVVADAWPQNLTFKSDLKPLLQITGLYKAPITEAAAPIAQLHAVVDVRIANLREKPSTAAAVVTKLARNDEVVPVQRRGRWVFVRIGDGPNQKQGWIFNSVLKDSVAAAAKPAY